MTRTLKSEKQFQLTAHLSNIPGLKVDFAMLSSNIIGLGIELSYIKQKDIFGKDRNIGAYNIPIKRSIVEACKKVGRPTEIIGRGQESESIVQTPAVDFDESIELLQQLQDEYDAERNNEDTDECEVGDLDIQTENCHW